MHRAFHQAWTLTLELTRQSVRIVRVAGPTCHATGSADKGLIRFMDALDAIASGDLLGVAMALIWAVGNFALFLESASTAYKHLRET